MRIPKGLVAIWIVLTSSASYCGAQTTRVPTFHRAAPPAPAPPAPPPPAPPPPPIVIVATTPPATSNGLPCWLFPTRGGCMSYGPGTPNINKDNNINTFYGTVEPLSFFNQIKSIYNGASSSATGRVRLPRTADLTHSAGRCSRGFAGHVRGRRWRSSEWRWCAVCCWRCRGIGPPAAG